MPSDVRRIASDYELKNCHHAALTSAAAWDPLNVPLMDKKRKWIEENVLFISQVKREKSDACNRDCSTHEIDTILSSINVGLFEQVTTERMVSNVDISDVTASLQE